MSVKGEKYSSPKAMKKHESSEGAKERTKEYGKSKAHPGFAATQKKIAQQKNPRTGKKVGMATAGAILASGARKASPKAVKANPRLKRVRGR